MPVEIRVELFLLEPGRAVDALQHLALRVAAPVRAGGVRQLEVLERDGVGHVRAAAQVDERPVGVGRDDLVVAAARERRSSLSGSSAKRFCASARFTSSRTNGYFSAGDLPHLASRTRARSSGVNGLVDLEVVVEAVVDRRAEADLRVGAHSRTAVASTCAAEWRSTSSASGSRSVRMASRVSPSSGPVQVAHRAVHLRRHRRPREPRADRLGHRAGRRSGRHLTDAAVRQGDLDGRAHGAS